MRRSREEFLRKLHAACPHVVDLVLPSDGFSPSTDEAIFQFIYARVGAMDMYMEREDGVAFVRYCFLNEVDANDFRARFCRVAEIIGFPKAANW